MQMKNGKHDTTQETNSMKVLCRYTIYENS